MRILVCGACNWVDSYLVWNGMERYLQVRDNVVIHGACRGAATRGQQVAENLKSVSEVMPFPADWKKWGKAAGPVRNQQMLDEGRPDVVLAFHDDIEHSKDTKDMINRARKAGIRVEVISHAQPAR